MDIIFFHAPLVAPFGWRPNGLIHLPDFRACFLIGLPIGVDSYRSTKLSLINYTVDAYLFAAASALAASTVSRSIFGAAFPVSMGPVTS
jgi:hypothetical protein